MRADYNRLELRQVAAEGNEIIISYHWMRQLKTEPTRKLERIYIGDDPVGFIRITDPAGFPGDLQRVLKGTSIEL